MKSKQEILSALAQTEDDRVLLAGLMDKEQTCVSRGYLTHSRFLDLRERALAAEAVRLMGSAGHTVFWGGYDDAERVLAVFYPEYLEEPSAREQTPLALLRAHKHPGDTLSHRDYLGALMGLQIDRAVIGDILVHDGGADVLVLEDMAEFILLHFDKAGRKRLTLSREPLASLRQAQAGETEGEGSVASPRLDAVLALVFRLSRGEAQEQIARGAVFLNHAQCLKGERTVAEGDRLTLRGMGRVRILSFGGVSRKGRIFIKFVKSC
ncbi:YlmH family RNA-binding protein [Agathobaculum sp.]|uniref:YlmH family RNA-binding protein n=1 Tax=Agathobaculum sp. TaxID=2048138 RepID=UPI002A7F012C|nr:YlmH/Sll1252 family protein [Agathobaculum sp.]MDY3617861.1 YlmH/Sll1252 family protein [Agathobaculum sp.]